MPRLNIFIQTPNKTVTDYVIDKVLEIVRCEENIHVEIEKEAEG